MRVILLRHGSRSTMEVGDSALNSTGKVQAELLAKNLAPQGPLPQPARLIASPKKRAKQTLTPLAELTQLKLEIEPRLDERHQHESQNEFDARIVELLKELGALESTMARDATIYLCSHLDWLESAMLLMKTDITDRDLASSWTNCEYRQFRVADQFWSFAAGGIISARQTSR